MRPPLRVTLAAFGLLLALARGVGAQGPEVPADAPAAEVAGGEAAAEGPTGLAALTDAAFLHQTLTVVDGEPITPAKILVALLLLALGYGVSLVVSKLIGRILLKRIHVDGAWRLLIQSTVFYLLLLLSLVAALNVANVPLTVFTLLGGAVALGFGFGSQTVVSNIICGAMLLVERTLRPGDMLELDGGLQGTVERVGARSTLLRTPSGASVIVPNSHFVEQRFTNLTLSGDLTRTSVAVGVAYGSPTRDVARLLRQAVDDEANVLQEPEPIVLLSDFGTNALAFEVHFWVRMERMMERRRIESDVRFRIDALFREAGIVLAFPQRDVHLDTTRPLEIRVVPAPASGGAGTVPDA